MKKTYFKIIQRAEGVKMDGVPWVALQDRAVFWRQRILSLEFNPPTFVPAAYL